MPFAPTALLAPLLLAAAALLISPGLLRLAAWLPRQVDEQIATRARAPRAQQALFGLLAALLAALCGQRYGLSVTGVAAAVFVLLLLTLGWIDATTGLLPDALTLLLLWLGLLANLDGRFALLPEAVLGAVLGYGFFWVMYQLFFWLTRREGLGYGDFKLLAAIGAWLGWQVLANVVLLASLAALVITALRRAYSGQMLRQPLHYGPYLAAAAAAQLFWNTSWMPFS